MDASVFAYSAQFRLTQLQGILFDIGNVYLQIFNNGNKVANDENTIRDAFASFLQNDEYKNISTGFVRYYQVDTEVIEGIHGRTDIRFLKVKEYEGQQVYYTVECKRLDGKNHLCKEYVENGIRRFTTGKYPTQLGCNAMLGFVVCDIELGATVDKINRYLMPNEHLQTKSTEMLQMMRLESQHDTPHPFELYHLWTEFSKLVE